jgi:hypothetical protein
MIYLVTARSGPAAPLAGGEAPPMTRRQPATLGRECSAPVRRADVSLSLRLPWRTSTPEHP